MYNYWNHTKVNICSFSFKWYNICYSCTLEPRLSKKNLCFSKFLLDFIGKLMQKFSVVLLQEIGITFTHENSYSSFIFTHRLFCQCVLIPIPIKLCLFRYFVGKCAFNKYRFVCTFQHLPFSISTALVFFHIPIRQISWKQIYITKYARFHYQFY